ncbi:hypothetical protein V5799_019982 [Amblyomma americanum]|uniref:Uncharacterized protein n=1 Tax=Amblyomma americanum TaxID=6943 RepID=A0AAQ4EVC8_AMBAM
MFVNKHRSILVPVTTNGRAWTGRSSSARVARTSSASRDSVASVDSRAVGALLQHGVGSSECNCEYGFKKCEILPKAIREYLREGGWQL